jgi:hypothetical protein
MVGLRWKRMAASKDNTIQPILLSLQYLIITEVSREEGIHVPEVSYHRLSRERCSEIIAEVVELAEATPLAVKDPRPRQVHHVQAMCNAFPRFRVNSMGCDYFW